MSDLLSPLMVIMGDESHAYISFCALMSRMGANFKADGELMTQKFEHLSAGILYYDPEFYAYLKLCHSDDLLFCYRWLLLEMKREFSFDDACFALEVLWSSLPPPPQSQMCAEEEGSGVQLYETLFRPREPQNIVGLPTPPQVGGEEEGKRQRRKTVFSNVVSTRKRISSTENEAASGDNSLSKGSVSVPRGRRILSASSAETETKSSIKRAVRVVKSMSLGKSPAAALLSSNANANDDDDGKDENGVQSSAKKVKDLNEFYRMSSKLSSCNSADGDGGNGEGCFSVPTSPSNTSSIVESPQVQQQQQDDDDEEEEDVPSPVSDGITLPYNRLPPPTELGGGNPFLMFMCLACILQHRDYIIEQQLDYQEIAMFFDRMVRRHDVRKTLTLARKMFASYLNDDWRKEVLKNNIDVMRGGSEEKEAAAAADPPKSC
jgi:hypothetical protein